jgi:hypothetical protein
MLKSLKSDIGTKRATYNALGTDPRGTDLTSVSPKHCDASGGDGIVATLLRDFSL